MDERRLIHQGGDDSPEGELFPKSGGTFLAATGIACIRHEGKLYLINFNRDREGAVEELSHPADVRMFNPHLDRSRRDLTAEEIGEYPFIELRKKLARELEKQDLFDLLICVIDPELSEDVKDDAARDIEAIITKDPEYFEGAIREHLEKFDPPTEVSYKNSGGRLDKLIAEWGERLEKESTP